MLLMSLGAVLTFLLHAHEWLGVPVLVCDYCCCTSLEKKTTGCPTHTDTHTCTPEGIKEADVCVWVRSRIAYVALGSVAAALVVKAVRVGGKMRNRGGGGGMRRRVAQTGAGGGGGNGGGKKKEKQKKK
jgi:hypothetical protein